MPPLSLLISLCVHPVPANQHLQPESLYLTSFPIPSLPSHRSFGCRCKRQLSRVLTFSSHAVSKSEVPTISSKSKASQRSSLSLAESSIHNLLLIMKNVMQDANIHTSEAEGCVLVGPKQRNLSPVLGGATVQSVLTDTGSLCPLLVRGFYGGFIA